MRASIQEVTIQNKQTKEISKEKQNETRGNGEFS